MTHVWAVLARTRRVVRIGRTLGVAVRGRKAMTGRRSVGVTGRCQHTKDSHDDGEDSECDSVVHVFTLSEAEQVVKGCDRREWVVCAVQCAPMG